jgi:hypothetical protein
MHRDNSLVKYVSQSQSIRIIKPLKGQFRHALHAELMMMVIEYRCRMVSLMPRQTWRNFLSITVIIRIFHPLDSVARLGKRNQCAEPGDVRRLTAADHNGTG